MSSNLEKEKISVIIPCYNSELSIGVVVERLINTLSSQNDYEYEIILANDGSSDNTWGVIRDIAINNSFVTSLNFSRNFGQHSAIMALYREISGDYVVGMDDDGEHNPEELFKLIDELKKGYDYVCADYEEDRGNFRSFGTKMNNWMAEQLIDKPKDTIFSSFFAVKKFVAEEIIRYKQPFPYVAGLTLRATHNLSSVPMSRGKRMHGKSGYNLKSMLKLWINGYTGFSLKPLRMANIFGTMVAAICFVSTVVVIIMKLVNGISVPGYASLMAAISFFCGIIMMLLGFIGEYIGRIYISINNAPQYVVKEKIKNGQNINV